MGIRESGFKIVAITYLIALSLYTLIVSYFTLFGIFFIYFILFCLDMVAINIFDIKNNQLRFEFKLFVSGWLLLGMVLGELYTFKSVVRSNS